MPTKNIVKSFDAPAFYHVYNRASGERLLFRSSADRVYFLMLLQKHLDETEPPENEEPMKQYGVEVIAYCLMGTHFHLLLFQAEGPQAISGYMRSIGTQYSMYYNKKYKSKGHVFQSSYRASHISTESYLAHITRYIHLNPRDYLSWRWSSYGDYVGLRQSGWVHPERVLEDSFSCERYAQFVRDYARTDKRKQYTDVSDYLAH